MAFAVVVCDVATCRSYSLELVQIDCHGHDRVALAVVDLDRFDVTPHGEQQRFVINKYGTEPTS